MKLSKAFWATFMGFLFFLSCAETSSVTYTLGPEKNVAMEELIQKFHGLSDYIWIDCRPYEDYQQGHIPGALHHWREETSDELGNVLPKNLLEELFSKKGIDPTKQFILYDDHGASESARLWWIFHSYGFDNVQIMDGSFSAWKELGGQVDASFPEVAPVFFEFEEYTLAATSIVYEELVEQLSSNSDLVLLDNRSMEEYHGLMIKEGAERGGNIPGSIHLDFIDMLRSIEERDFRFQPLDSLKAIFNPIIPSLETPVIVYCHSGARSAQVAFVLTQLLGYKNVKNYDGSWREWSQRSEQ
jgi:thiosulfate/3-mercaptopyruvate sulfurtransferase